MISIFKVVAVSYLLHCIICQALFAQSPKPPVEVAAFKLPAIPSMYSLNQFYRFHGEITDALFVESVNNGHNFQIQLQFQDVANQTVWFKCDHYFANYGQQHGAKNQSVKFEMICLMNPTGTYRVRLIAASINNQNLTLNEQLKTLITIKPAPLPLPPAAQPLKSNLSPLSLTLSLPFGYQPTISWHRQSGASPSKLINLTFYQHRNNSVTVSQQFILSNSQTQFILPFAAFAGFQVGPTVAEISEADSIDGTYWARRQPFSVILGRLQFYALRHALNEFGYKGYQATPPLPLRLNSSQSHSSTLIFEVDVKNFFYWSTPTPTISKIPFMQHNNAQQAIIRNGTPVHIEIKVDAPGVYFIEVETTKEESILNWGVYVGQGIPLVPQYHDIFWYPTGLMKFLSIYLLEGKLTPQPLPNASLAEKQKFVLLLLNSLRKYYKRLQLLTTPKLVFLAQNISSFLVNETITTKYPSMESRLSSLDIQSKVSQFMMMRNSLTACFMERIVFSGSLYKFISDQFKYVGIGIGMLTDLNNETMYFMTIDLANDEN